MFFFYGHQISECGVNHQVLFSVLGPRRSFTDRLCVPEEKERAEAEKMSAAGGFGRKFVENLRTAFPAKVDTWTKSPPPEE